MSSPQRKRRRTCEGEKQSSRSTDCASNEEMASSASKVRVVLILCGSMNPVTNLHLRMFGNWSIHLHAQTTPCIYQATHNATVLKWPSGSQTWILYSLMKLWRSRCIHTILLASTHLCAHTHTHTYWQRWLRTACTTQTSSLWRRVSSRLFTTPMARRWTLHWCNCCLACGHTGAFYHLAIK